MVAGSIPASPIKKPFIIIDNKDYGPPLFFAAVFGSDKSGNVAITCDAEVCLC
jgi:hypothetical protein